MKVQGRRKVIKSGGGGRGLDQMYLMYNALVVLNNVLVANAWNFLIQISLQEMMYTYRPTCPALAIRGPLH